MKALLTVRELPPTAVTTRTSDPLVMTSPTWKSVVRVAEVPVTVVPVESMVSVPKLATAAIPLRAGGGDVECAGRR